MPSSRDSSRPGDQTQVCLCLLHCRQNLYPLSHLGSPKRGRGAHKLMSSTKVEITDFYFHPAFTFLFISFVSEYCLILILHVYLFSYCQDHTKKSKCGQIRRLNDQSLTWDTPVTVLKLSHPIKTFKSWANQDSWSS